MERKIKRAVEVNNYVSNKPMFPENPEEKLTVFFKSRQIESGNPDNSLSNGDDETKKKNTIHAVLTVLRKIRFGLDNPLQILRKRLNWSHFDLNVFVTYPRLFSELQRRLYNRLRRSKYHKYAFLIKLTTKLEFEWQIGIMWDILENTKHSQGTYPLLVDLLSN